MERLREVFTSLGLHNVRTYIQSGNVFFESDVKDRAALTRKAEQRLLNELGYEVPVFVRTVAEIEKALTSNPFKAVRVTPDVRLCVIFTSDPLPPNLKLPLHSPKNDFELLAKTHGEVFVVMRQLPGRAGNPSAFIEKTFNVKATSRFFATAEKILEAAKTHDD
jgi:uncharacterized protein (DUF1697 family)